MQAHFSVKTEGDFKIWSRFIVYNEDKKSCSTRFDNQECPCWLLMWWTTPVVILLGQLN